MIEEQGRERERTIKGKSRRARGDRERGEGDETPGSSCACRQDLFWPLIMLDNQFLLFSGFAQINLSCATLRVQTCTVQCSSHCHVWLLRT